MVAPTMGRIRAVSHTQTFDNQVITNITLRWQFRRPTHAAKFKKIESVLHFGFLHCLAAYWWYFDRHLAEIPVSVIAVPYTGHILRVLDASRIVNEERIRCYEMRWE